MQPISAENLFSRSWEILNRNWSIVIPGLIVAIVSGVVTYLLAPSVYVGDGTVVVTTSFLGRSFAFIVQTLAAIITISYTTGMAAAAWRTGTASFADGYAAFTQEGGHVFTAMIALFIAGIVAAILAPFTIGLSLLACFFLFLYTMAAAVIGNYGWFAALAESYRIAVARAATTAIILVVFIVIAIVAGIIGGLLHFTPLVGPLISEIIQMIVLAYITIVVVGAYIQQAATPVPVTVGAAQATAAPPPYAPPPASPPPPPYTPPPSPEEPPATAPS